MRRPITTIALLIGGLVWGAAAAASTAFGTLGNFDTVNDTGQICHGFEIELDDLHSTDVTYTYDYNHYNTPKIREDNTDPAHPKVFIRYESGRSATGAYLAFTAVPAAPIAPTDGHQCTNPGVNLGCEHFGVGYSRSPTAERYHWLVDDGAGHLVRGPAVIVAMPTFNYFPPAVGQPAFVQAVIPAPEPVEVHVQEFGPAVWVKSIVTTAHNSKPIPLRDLVSDDPNIVNDANWKNGEADEVETEWDLLQEEFAKADGANNKGKGKDEPLPRGDEVVTRRYEFFKYSGPFDAETNEALCDTYPDPAPTTPECATELLGDYLGAQMAGFNVEAPLGLIDHIQDGNKGVAYPRRSVVVGGNSPYVTSVSVGALPPGLVLNTTTGVLSGTPTTVGQYPFTVHTTDADNVVTHLAYSVAITAIVAAGDVDGDGDIDLNDINLMKTHFNQRSAGPADRNDVNGDGFINILDFRAAVAKCTRARCAVS